MTHSFSPICYYLATEPLAVQLRGYDKSCIEVSLSKTPSSQSDIFILLQTVIQSLYSRKCAGA